MKEDKCRVVDRARGTHKLGGSRVRPVRKPAAKSRSAVIPCPTLEALPSAKDWENALPKFAVVELGAAHYRRSELPYGAGTPFRARAAVFATGTTLCFAVSVVKSDLCFRRETDPNPQLDNETADIHSDGIQCYVGGEDWRGYLLVPDPDSESVRSAAVAGTAGDTTQVSASWARTARGYNLLAAIDLGAQLQLGQKIPLNLVVNEMYSKRQRRAGQLALSGGGWVYLRGDREHSATALVGEVS